MINKLKELRNGGEEEGFTLIELMIVVVIIGILAAIAIPIFANQQKAAINAGVKSDVRNLQLQVATYLVKNPQATNLGYFRDGLATPTGPLADNGAIKFTPSDSVTIVRVKDLTAPNAIGPGAWDGYGIVGVTNSLRYSFNSATGAYTESN
jgi:type IV pilus assembly protein PilA